jgi:hypothetical protein
MSCDSLDIPFEYPPTLEAASNLVWNAIRIRDDIATEAAAFATGTFAAVHFRGSDKVLESPRVSISTVLDVVAREMDALQLHRLFVASDERTFVESARMRFGSEVFWLPLRAFASSDGTPPHFSRVPGDVKAREALTTMLILAHAKVLIKTESLLSDWATTLAQEQRVVRVSGSRKAPRGRRARARERRVGW